MANTSEKHKLKKSQKRKERQARRLERKAQKTSEELRECAVEHGAVKMKGTSKSLPGFLAKHADMICKWLRDYQLLFVKADDQCIDFLTSMPRERRDEMVQEYIDISYFINAVRELKNAPSKPASPDAGTPSQEKREDEAEEDAVQDVV